MKWIARKFQIVLAFDKGYKMLSVSASEMNYPYRIWGYSRGLRIESTYSRWATPLGDKR